MADATTGLADELLGDDLEPVMGTGEATELAEMFQALGDATRLRILSVLDTVCVPVGTIAELTGLRQPAVSHHLRVLRDRGLVRPEHRGAYTYYCVSSEALRSAVHAARLMLADRKSS